MIHPTAIISKSAEIDSTVTIGPYSVVGNNVKIAGNTTLESHVVIKKNTIIGTSNKIHQFASIGEDPQDLKFDGEETTLTIGDNNIFREYCTVNRGTITGINETIIGSNNLFMTSSHIAHDCVIKDNCILSNAASLAGHVRIGNNVSLGGFTLVHQFCEIGDYAFSGLGTVISRDVTPYTLVAGNHAQAYKINTAGLKRKGFDVDVIKGLEKLFRLLIKSRASRQDVKLSIKELNLNFKEAKNFIDFVNSSERGVTR
ncbi:MAG: acyl-ACP--UDP-N-acetylglucosamine O-acyltransferase [Gammaproteobacteria bacterium]|jgi:UDP-N-acetylglucosamine acyltransferase|nr:acyl-ACP--UDP-N-acetylglucosamine O-acyltransferase [Gammaproteobacteria bacterium]MBT4462130.1 acyl-ACP--UDP-N-acetylglucosamine O-acyltransferase [Gammaproteobacteria bacterium]MBT4654989.1 acyl-ACP--UDP-N-acetylglucosamine O-acyltransferase [Gammaproteobacteria bacterium]MBT5116497.1 acyl-ACP--UDP-N-acetylglucosamine O-acyltransferase [Gammaproteobacteria bacterium]MBT5761526.1 acyl-ACP--UDP-N-acetylglucosamine O-acyltransferase [Gammaproteobacteria bacterium]